MHQDSGAARAMALYVDEVAQREFKVMHAVDKGQLHGAAGELGGQVILAKIVITGQGVDALTATVIKGKGGMPPKGLAMAASDAEIKSAVEYMLSQVK